MRDRSREKDKVFRTTFIPYFSFLDNLIQTKFQETFAAPHSYVNVPVRGDEEEEKFEPLNYRLNKLIKTISSSDPYICEVKTKRTTISWFLGLMNSQIMTLKLIKVQ